MTIKKNQPWGDTKPLAGDGVVVSSDAEAAEVLTAALAAGKELPTVGLLGGDLCRTLGGPGDPERLRGPDARTYPIDLGWAVVDGEEHLFVAHLIARKGWWRSRVVAVMNAQWLGTWDLGPKSHPNDGILDVSDGDIGFGDRIKARKRLLTGTHIPHPGIVTSRTKKKVFEFEPPLDVFLDGIEHQRASQVEVRVEPDAFQVVI